jgi:hypothetical protein
MDGGFNPESKLKFALDSMTLTVCELFSILLVQRWGLFAVDGVKGREAPRHQKESLKILQMLFKVSSKCSIAASIVS